MQIKDDMVLTWPDKLKGDPSKDIGTSIVFPSRPWARHLWVLWLKATKEALIKQVKLQRFVGRERLGENPSKDLEPNQWAEKRLKASLGEIRVIVGGSTMAGSSRKVRKTYLQMVQKVQITSRLPKLKRVDDSTISFIEEDAWWLHHPHDDALVINLSIADLNARQILVDNGSSVDILYYLTVQQMRIGKEWLLPSTHHL